MTFVSPPPPPSPMTEKEKRGRLALALADYCDACDTDAGIRAVGAMPIEDASRLLGDEAARREWANKNGIVVREERPVLPPFPPPGLPSFPGAR
jgi:hypothetical protein